MLRLLAMRNLAIGFTLLPIFSLFAAVQNPSPSPNTSPDTVTLTGRVVNALTGDPVRNVNLRLIIVTNPSERTVGSEAVQNASAVSDAQGNFQFTDLLPGRYTLSADKTGFVRQQYGARAGQLSPSAPLIGEPGQQIKELTFPLTPQAVISGHVLNEGGGPLSQVSVQIFRQTGYFRNPTNMTSTATNDLGQFLIGNLAAGKYIIRADTRNINGTVLPAPGAARLVYLPTFYPSATDLRSAVCVAVTAGQQVSGIEIWLQKGQVFRVRGKIRGAPSDSVRTQVALAPQTPAGGFFDRSQMARGGNVVRNDGSFEFPSVQPGPYVLTVTSFAAGGQMRLSARVPVTVSNADVDDLLVESGAVPLAAISGKISVEGDDHAKLSGNVLLQTTDIGQFFPVTPPARIQDDGSFQSERIFPGKYFINVTPLPPGSYLKQVRAGTAEIIESGLDLSESSPPQLQILIGSNPASIEGTVRRDDKPWPSAFITLLPDSLRPESFRHFARTAIADQNGLFKLNGIPPGEYRVYAWEEAVSVPEIDPDELKPYDSFAVKIKLAEGDHEQMDLSPRRSNRNNLLVLVRREWFPNHRPNLQEVGSNALLGN
jgi:5-hydroxyisourate hydrolase-like protein (transthyretin family)